LDLESVVVVGTRIRCSGYYYYKISSSSISALQKTING